MKTVKHQLEVKKLTEEEMPTEILEMSIQIQLILVTDEETEKSIVSQESSKQDEIPIEIHETNRSTENLPRMQAFRLNF